jgi:hypothetical protein
VIDPGKENADRLPISYAVRKKLSLPHESVLKHLEDNCTVCRMRAILCWNVVPPTGICREIDPMKKIYWGDVKDAWIRLHK